MTRRREWVLVAALLVVQVIGPHTGGRSVGGLAAGVGAAAAVLQVVALVQLPRRPVVIAGAITLLYAVQCVVVDVVLPVVLWVALWRLALLVPRRAWALRATVQLTVAAVLVELGAELLHPGAGLGAVAAAVTVAVGLGALLRRSERARLDAVRSEAATSERLRLAADLHDLAGHGLGVVAVQSSTARMALEHGDLPAAQTALAAVEASSRTALKEMRQLLDVLRGSDGADAGPAPGLAELPALVDGVRAGGLDVEARLAAPEVSAAVGLCAYRIVQEALTNVLKHSGGGPVQVVVEPRDARLHVSVRSEGAASAPRGSGSGLDGIRARVAAVGGVTRIGPTGTGWSVEAELPLEAP